MFPIRDHNPSRRPALVTYVLIAVNLAVFLAMLPSYGDERALLAIYSDWALLPARISSGSGYVTFFTSMFMHGGLMHIAGNMLFLWIFGDNLEDEMGHLRYLGFYLLCGLAAGMAQYLADPGSRVPMVGASGAIAGVMGGYLLLFPKARVDVLFIFIIFFKVFPLPAWVMLGLWFALQVVAELGSTAGTGGVAHLAHVGGFVAGVVLALPLWLRLGGTAYWQRTHGRPVHTAARYARSSVPVVRRR
ncbi:rhomboid family intramembrane serine protease [Celeribacter sp. SCSIO 80788]|uniref:rhomboid family intramembrane serine protease n=1 Tax=Celeribacter sp. SCSIO 80788 TaxID=3117013 RepID=UPI003DA3F474